MGPFLQALVAASVTAGATLVLVLGLNLSFAATSHATGHYRNRSYGISLAASAFIVTLLVNWTILATGTTSVGDMNVMMFASLCLLGAGSGFMFTEALQPKSGWAIRLASVVVVALLVCMFIILMLQP